jgi:hypothetical protein
MARLGDHAGATDPISKAIAKPNGVFAFEEIADAVQFEPNDASPSPRRIANHFATIVMEKILESAQPVMGEKVLEFTVDA